MLKGEGEGSKAMYIENIGYFFSLSLVLELAL